MPDKPAPNFSRYPMLWLATAFGGGILTTDLTTIDPRAALAAFAIFATPAIIFRGQYFASVLVFIAFIGAGAGLASIEKLSIKPDRIRVLYDDGTIASGDPVEIEGVLNGRPEPAIDGVLINLRTEKLTHRGVSRNVSGNVRLFLPQTKSDVAENNFSVTISDMKYGSRLRIACGLTREDEFLNPGVIRKSEILSRLDVDATGSVKSLMLVEKIADESVFVPLAWIYDQRASMVYDFRDSLSPPAAGVMIASLLGDKYFLDKATADLFREGGTFHILVISGLHITFIGGLLLLFLRQITRNRWTQFVVTIVILWAYTLAVGADVPVVRAAIMFTTISFAYVIYRDGDLMNSLGICAIVLLVWRPSDLFNPSFQLTFVSVASIIMLAYPLIDSLRRIGRWMPSAREPFPPKVPDWLRRFCETLYWNNATWVYESKRQIWSANLFKSPLMGNRVKRGVQKSVGYLFEGVLLSFVVQVCMLPLSVVYFHRVSAISILLNLWVGVFIALESFTAVVGVFVNKISVLLGAGFFMLAEMFNWMMLAVPRLFADNSWVSFRLPAYSGYGRAIYVLYFLPVILFALVVNRWRPFDLTQRIWITRPAVLLSATASLLLFFSWIVFHPFSDLRPDGRLHIDFLDVGQGDAALVTFPDGTTLLVDGGGRVKYKTSGDDGNDLFEPDVRGIGEAVVSEFLWNRGYSRIDYLLATHADADHMQGLTDVVKNFDIGQVMFGRMPESDADFAELTRVLRNRGTPIAMISRGHYFDFGGASGAILYPNPRDNFVPASDNDNSVVLRITFGNRAFLLTGDIEKHAESDLIASGAALTADIVKVPHHGSRTSSTSDFANRLGAGYAIISVGRSSAFGHPHADVVERWKASGANVMTTGERGTISVSTDGKDIEIRTFAP